MIRLILGLGNPGGEYENTRHNTGRDAAVFFAKKLDFDGFLPDKRSSALISSNKVGKSKIMVALPETFMNKSGSTAAKLFKAKKENTDLVVIHDDLDIPLGRFKISYGKNSGGHKGVESVMRALKTKKFVRIRIGVSPKHKPDSKDVIKFIVGKFKPAEAELVKKTFKRISEALECMATDSLEKAMSEFN
ncbi:MAG: aminoacyl-tRNA hydrolase [Candidatus Liptonbacteria bacterium]|nr:aminoacyl-tRNA hydrolase [Candidatus Liptonbacteria bacterium]